MGAFALPHRTSRRAQYPLVRPLNVSLLSFIDAAAVNDSERAAKIAKISKIAKTSGGPSNPRCTEERAEFWGLARCMLLEISTSSSCRRRPRFGPGTWVTGSRFAVGSHGVPISRAELPLWAKPPASSSRLGRGAGVESGPFLGDGPRRRRLGLNRGGS